MPFAPEFELLFNEASDDTCLRKTGTCGRSLVRKAKGAAEWDASGLLRNQDVGHMANGQSYFFTVMLRISHNVFARQPAHSELLNVSVMHSDWERYPGIGCQH